MTTGVKRTAFWFAVAALALAAPEPATAQQSRQDCRCVDADGNAIADCTCFRTPRFDEMAFAVGLQRPRLGIRVDADQGSELDARGAEITDVLEDGPAWEAGLRDGDVITRIDGRSLFEPLGGDREGSFDLDQSMPVQRLLAIVREIDPGDEVEVTYLRGGEERTATITAEDLNDGVFGFAPTFEARRLRDQLGALRGLERLPGLPDGPVLRGTPPTAVLLGRSRFGGYGLELTELNEGLSRYFGTEEGVLVLDARGDSELGLQAGDVILRIGDRDATTPDRVRRILESYAPDEDITIHIRRDGREMSVLGRLPG